MSESRDNDIPATESERQQDSDSGEAAAPVGDSHQPVESDPVQQQGDTPQKRAAEQGEPQQVSKEAVLQEEPLAALETAQHDEPQVAEEAAQQVEPQVPGEPEQQQDSGSSSSTGDESGETLEKQQPLSSTRSSTSASDRKRSRPASSLDYKLSDSEQQKHVVTPPKPNQQQREQFVDYEKQHSTRITPTRARGGGIPPKSKLELSDLVGMPHDEIMRALYEDPELAAAVAAEAEAGNQTPPRPSRSKERRRTPGKTTGPPRVEQLKDRGFPYVQWIILLVLLLLALYQLYKSLAPSKPKAKVTGSKTKTPKKSPKPKSKPTTNNRSVKKPAALAKKEEEAETDDTAVKEFPKKDTKTKPKKVKVTKKKPEPVPEEKPTTKTAVADTSAAMMMASNAQAVDPAFNDDEGWQTVGGGGSAQTTAFSEPKTKTAPVVPFDQALAAAPIAKKATPKPATPAEAAIPVPLPTETLAPAPETPSPVPAPVMTTPETTTSADSTTPAETTNELVVVKPKKKKNKPKNGSAHDNKRNGSSAPENGYNDKPVFVANGTATDADAALALKLQQEEDAVLTTDVPAVNDVAATPESWEAVKTKKRRPKTTADEI